MTWGGITMHLEQYCMRLEAQKAGQTDLILAVYVALLHGLWQFASTQWHPLVPVPVINIGFFLLPLDG